MPAKYRAQALVGSAPMVQDRLTFGNRPDLAAQVTAQEQVRAVRETLLTDANILKVNDEFRLYPAATRTQRDKAIKDIRDQIAVQVEGTDAFDIEFTGDRPDEVARIANRLANVFVEQTTVLRNTHADQQDSFLDNAVTQARRKLEEEEGTLRSYRQSGADQVPERFADNLKEYSSLQEQVQAKNDQIMDAEAKRSADQAELAAIEKQGVNDPEPQERTPAEIQIDEVKRRLAQLQARYTPQHPEIIRTEKELRDLEASVPSKPAAPVHHDASQLKLRYLALQAELKSLDPKIAAYKQDRAALETQVQNYQRVINASPGYDTTLTERTRDVNDARVAYEALLAKQQDAHLNHQAEKDDSGPVYRVLEPAQVPETPYSPHRARLLLLAFAGALGLSLAGLVITERMDTTFETSEDFEAYTDIPLLVTIPTISSVGRAGEKNGKVAFIRPARSGAKADVESRYFTERICVIGEPDSVASQQYGILALKVRKWMSRTAGKTLVITSSTGGEGKSLTALNLSFALASALDGGVLLIDCDLRLPQAKQRLGLEQNLGLADLLSEDSDMGPLNAEDWKPYITRIGRLDVLTAGTDSASRAHLLSSPRARDLMRQLRDQYRIVVLDSPPVVPIADSHTLSELADGVLMVLRARRTRPDLFERALSSLEARNLVGVVLNDVEYSATPYAYAYRYYQQHYMARR